MRRILRTFLPLFVCGFFVNCFLNPLSKIVTDTAFPAKEDCPNCEEQLLLAVSSVLRLHTDEIPRADGIQAFALDLSAFFPFYCIAGICAGGITENQPTSTVSVAVPNGTDLTSLKPNFLIPENSKLEVNGETQVSGTSIQNFTNPVIYKFTDSKGAAQSYTVTVSPALPEDRVNGTVLFPAGDLWTKCSYGQVWRPGFNDCKGKGNESDNYGANTDIVFCDTADASCDIYGNFAFQNACLEMQQILSPPNIPMNVLRAGDFNRLSALVLCNGFSKGPSCGTADQCPGNSGTTVNESLFPQTVNGYYWTSSICSPANMQVIQFGGLSNTTVQAKNGKGKVLRCTYNIFS
ncbi:glycoside hydrolase xylanase [Leptospira weilii]|uniref:glycoside hydrolase xylanase n=1 Tax=Leptospira weilii TaxID=28184 RepID=UPI00256F0DE5|nr:glycoside hydrolase xylanase [Leptospira weilii]MDL5246736.1 glycoside hydrolase xylanase [Leptospira weilii]